MTNYVQKGENITITATSATTSGQGVLVGNLFGIAAGNAEIGDSLDLVTVGVFDMPKVSTDVMAVGDFVYRDDTAKLATADDDTGNNELIGLAVTAAANPSGTVNVRLNGYDDARRRLPYAHCAAAAHATPPVARGGGGIHRRGRVEI